MRVTVQTMVAALIGATLMVAGPALACKTGCAPPAPPSPPSHPKPPSMPSHGCGGGGCGGGHHGGGGGKTNVNVNVNVKANASASGSGSGSGGGTYYGGGYGNWSQTPGYPSSMALNVTTGQGGGNVVTQDVETYQERITRTKTMVLQANCLDSKGAPHPASQVFGGRDVDGRYVGEVYRCIAGTYMQVTMVEQGGSSSGYTSTSGYGSDYYECGALPAHCVAVPQGSMPGSPVALPANCPVPGRGGFVNVGSGNGGSGVGGVDFNGGKVLTCRKGEALWFEGGNLSCRVQAPARNCNERSLLRRFGAGIKVVTMTVTEVVTRTRQSAYQSQSQYSSQYGYSSQSGYSQSGYTQGGYAAQGQGVSTSTMVFDGGVGGFVQ